MERSRSDIDSKTHKLEYEGRVVDWPAFSIKAEAVLHGKKLLTVVLKKTVNLTKKLGQTLGQTLSQTTQTQTPITNTAHRHRRRLVHRHR